MGSGGREMSELARRIVLTARWRWFDRMCPYRLRVCWKMTARVDEK